MSQVVVYIPGALTKAHRLVPAEVFKRHMEDHTMANLRMATLDLRNKEEPGGDPSILGDGVRLLAQGCGSKESRREQVSRICTELDGQVTAFRKPPTGCSLPLYLMEVVEDFGAYDLRAWIEG